MDEKKRIPQYVHFRSGSVQITKSLRKICVCYKLQPSLFKQEIEHDEIYDETWEAREDEWLPLVKNDVSPTAFCYARYTMAMETLSGYGKKNSATS